MYICFLFGIVCAAGHHIFYKSLDGKPAMAQTVMLRYGTLLSYAAKASFSAAVITAFKQRIWWTVRTRFMSIQALDSMFAAAENIMSMLDLDFLRGAKAAYALVLFAWTTPLVVILTANTLVVEPRTMMTNTTCPAVRTLNFSLEETSDWRTPREINGLFEAVLSIWNTTQRNDVDDPNWFDYYTGPSASLQQTAILGAFLEEVVARKGAAIDTCGMGWNCTFTINFTAPAYSCSEMASGVGSTTQNLTQESGIAVAPFGTDVLLPKGNFSYYAFTSGGEYSTTQMANVSIGGIPAINPPYPQNLGALRTEPVIWVGYAVMNNPNQTQPKRGDPGWDDAFTPKIFACEHRETEYVANISYFNDIQFTTILKRTFGAPIINTTFLPQVMAQDGTEDNTTAIPETNYVFPNDTARYRRVASYHSLGKMLRGFINGTVTVSDTLVQPIENTQAVQTKLIDSRNNYFPYPDLMARVQSLYDDIILSLFSNPQFVEVVWAANPAQMSGTAAAAGDDAAATEYPCTRSRTENSYAYRSRDLWLVYGVAALFTLGCIAAGALAIRSNGGVTRNTRFSSVVAATRGAALEKIAWRGPLLDRGEVPGEVKRLRLGYGLMSDLGGRLGAMEGVGPDPNLVVGEGETQRGVLRRSPGSVYTSGGYFGGEMRCGFGLPGDVDQRHKEGSLFHK